MEWNWAYTWDFMPTLLGGLRVTVIATVLGSVLAFIVGLLFAWARFSGPLWLRVPTTSVMEVIRRTPLLLQLYFLFYALPSWGISMPALTCGVLGLGLHYATYAAEVYRAGIESVPVGQWDASRALGLPSAAIWRRVVLPQGLRPVLPALGNLTIGMFKDSALLSTITVVELVAQARRVGTETFAYLEPMTAVAALFLIVSLIAGLGVHFLERRQVVSHGH